MFHDRSLLERCFGGFVLPVLEYWSAVWCSAANTHLKLLDSAVSGAWFLTGGVFECDIAHRRSVAVMCMLYKIRCNPVHPLNGAAGYTQPHKCRLHAVLWSHISTLMHCLAAEPRSTAGLSFPLQCPSGMILLTPYLMVWDWSGFKSRANAFFIGLRCSILTIIFYSFSLSLLSVNRLVLWGWGVQTDRVYITLSQPCTADLF